jgi:5'-AMP-activated protein kinase regulatory beta subunit
VLIAALNRGKHAYKFIVDDDWRFAPDQPTVSDTSGNINNYLDLTTFHPDDDTPLMRKDSIGNAPYGQVIPDEDEYTKEPPLLPPQLRSIILNSPSPEVADSTRLPVPMHVTLNHLYCTAIKDGLMVQATSQRYRRKHVSLVFYAPMPMASSTPIAVQRMAHQQMVIQGVQRFQN